jgi:CheY-like chemotaxis protein
VYGVPRVKEKASPFTSSNKETAMSGKKSRILVIDDEPDLASTLAIIFKSHNYITATAFSGEEAIDVAGRFQPDCIVTDVVMGGMSGIESAIVILSSLPKCKVLFISGNVDLRDLLGRNQLMNARAEGIEFELLQKPVPPPELLRRVSLLLSRP